MSKSTDWQAFSVELAMEAKKNLDAKDDEITTLRQQLAKSEAYILRKQAEAVEEIVDADPDGRSEDGSALISVNEIWDYAQRLRQQADEAERAGGRPT